MKFSSKAIHVGQMPEKEFGAIIPPVYLTSTFVQKEPGIHAGYDYTRAGNPNFSNLEATLAALEGAGFATVFSSGLGAIAAIASTLKQGDSVIAIDDLYGGTYRLFNKVFSNFGIDFVQFDLSDEKSLNDAFMREPRLLLLESPSNPLLKISDIRKIATKAKECGTISVVDNTFATPFCQNPLELGADVVVHSSTKYLGGHSDAIGGVVITNDEEFKKKMDFARMAIGLNPSPFDVWLISRSLKTLALRMERHEKNALAVAGFFQSHPKILKVYYPGLKTHDGYNIARSQMRGFGGILSVEFDLSLDETMRLISGFKLFALAESLGGVESLVEHPASMTHASIPKEERGKIGLSDALVRFSVGIEDIEDLIDDLEISLDKI